LSTESLGDQALRIVPAFDGQTVAIWIGAEEADAWVSLGSAVGALTRGATLVGLTVEGV
jgi:hypothetical protein